MPVVVLLKHLGKLTANKVLAPGSPDVAAVCERIQDETALKKVSLQQQHHFKSVAPQFFPIIYSTYNFGALKFVNVIALYKQKYQTIYVAPTSKSFIITNVSEPFSSDF